MSQLSTLSSGGLILRISSLGAELISLKKGDREYIYQKTEGFWQRQSPVLFPIVGALAGGVFEHKGKVYPMSQHGFARDMEFEKIEEAAGKISFRLISDAHTLERYPFPFELVISYIIEGNSLRIEYTIENTGSETMYFSIGGHPAFALDGDISEYALHFQDDEVLERYFLKDGLLESSAIINLQKNTLGLSDRLFAHDALVCKDIDSRQIELWRSDKRVIGIDRGNMPHFGIWRQPRAPFLCLEPWHGYASTHGASIQKFSYKEGIVDLLPGERRSFWWSIIL